MVALLSVQTVLLSAGIYLAYSLVTSWHPYDPYKPFPEQCARRGSLAYKEEYKRQTKPLINETIAKWKLWPNLISQKDVIEGETMYGFEEGMAAIWENQHPKDCSKAKFLISGGFESGFGSELHVIGAGMALAMNMGRVYVMLHDDMGSGLADKKNSLNRYQIQNDHCQRQKKLNLECYYEPWTSCSYEQIYKDTSLMKIRKEGKHMFFHQILQLNASSRLAQSRHLIVQHNTNHAEVDFVPNSLTPLMDCGPFQVDKIRYWWRSLSVAYLMRPNAATRALIQKHRLEDPTLQFDPNKEQCVSVYVRRGDKHLEMKLIKNETVFFETAKQLWQNLPNHDQQKQPVMFVGSEDPEVIDSALTWGVENNWKILYSNLFDRRNISTHLNNTLQQQQRKAGTFRRSPWEYFSMVLNLDYHSRCSAYVCTMGSNFCRVIDELRATVGSKANRQYADFTCLKAPCIDSPAIAVGWR